jgi:hypothetical protein
VTQAGKVSLLQNLSEDVARETVKRLTPWYNRPDCREYTEGGWLINESDVVKIEVFGPEGKALDVWRTNDATHA